MTRKIGFEPSLLQQTRVRVGEGGFGLDVWDGLSRWVVSGAVRCHLGE